MRNSNIQLLSEGKVSFPSWPQLLVFSSCSVAFPTILKTAVLLSYYAKWKKCHSLYEVLKVYILSSRIYLKDIFFKYICTSLLNFSFTCFQGWFLSNLHTVCPGFCCFKNFLILCQKRRASQSWITRKVSHPKGSVQIPMPTLTGVRNLFCSTILFPLHLGYNITQIYEKEIQICIYRWKLCCY